MPEPASTSRSIPACAGEPGHRRIASAFGWVYPRVCGGTLRGKRKHLRKAGLSPRVRGNQVAEDLSGIESGSIPACAGEPASCMAAICSSRVYPRVCGGTVAGAAVHAGGLGLSPRVRGNPSLSSPPPTMPWSIPACAGEPSAAWVDLCAAAVYPRVCGGTRLLLVSSSSSSGLSPRVRGNRRLVPPDAGYVGSIPACAGEPQGQSA